MHGTCVCYLSLIKRVLAASSSPDLHTRMIDVNASVNQVKPNREMAAIDGFWEPS